MAEGQLGLAIKPQTGGQSILRLLILEESASEAQSYIDPLRDAGFAVTAKRVKSPLEFQAALKKQEWDLIIAPLNLTGINAKQAMALLTHAKIDVPIVAISDAATEEDLTEALQFGARALLKKGQTEHLQLTVQREMRDLALRRARHHYEKMFRESERRCQSLLESSANAIAYIRNGKVLLSNPAFDRLISSMEQGAKNISQFIHPEDRQRFEELIIGVETGKNLSDKATLRLKNDNGKPRPVVIEAMVAHINEQQCAQLSLAVNTGPVAVDKKPELSAKPAENIAMPKEPSAADKDSAPIAHKPAGIDRAMEKKINDALAQNQFRLVYQPIVPLHAQPAETYEVLIRMIDENGEEIAPANFIPTAEQTGQMVAIDRWVIRNAMQTLLKQHSENKVISLMVKLSEDSLHDPALVAWVGELLQEYHLPGDTLIFEIKESNIIQRLDSALLLINGLKNLRCRTALGHFGGDPESLDCLEQLHVNFVKLAGSFVDNLSSDPKSHALIKAVVQTAHDLGSQTIATFVQDASKMSTLWQCNVDFIQGYFLQAPEEDLSYNFSDDE